MPGTIQVSVLDLAGLPSSSMSVKVSMGKREHQVWDKEEISFPLTTLRDSLIVTLYDNEGNELSRTGINTKLVVEKGLWNDLFPLEGGGHLRMKLQFILSEDERKKIQEMRKIALKKKQEELLSVRERRQETAAVADHNFVAAMRLQGKDPESGPESSEVVLLEHTNPTKADRSERTPAEAESSEKYEIHIAKLSQKHNDLHLTEATQQVVKETDSQLPNDVPSIHISSEEAFEYSQNPSNNENNGTVETSSAPIPSQEPTAPLISSWDENLISSKQIALKKTTRIIETDSQGSSSAADSSPDLKEFRHGKTTQQVMARTDNIQSRHNAVPTRFIASKEGLGSTKFMLGEKPYLACTSLDEHQIHSIENKTASEKTPSNVRKMIGAFESSLPQGLLPRPSALKIKPESNKVKRDVFLKEPSINETNMENTKTNKQIVGRELRPFSLRKPSEVNMQQNAMHLRSQQQVSISSQIGASDVVPIPRGSRQLEVLDARCSAVKGNDSIEHVDCNKEECMNTNKKLLDKLSETSEVEVATISGRILDDPVSKEHIQIVNHEEQGSRLDVLVEEKIPTEQFDCNIQHKKDNMDRQETLSKEIVGASEGTTLLEHPHTLHNKIQGSTFRGLEERGWRTYGDESDKINTSCNPSKKLRSLEYWGVEQETGGRRISPDETRRLCLTTASKQVIDFLGSCRQSDQRDLESSRLEDEKKDMVDSDTFCKENESEQTSHKPTRPKDDKHHGGLIGQGIRIAIMVAFGTLVIVTRAK